MSECLNKQELEFTDTISPEEYMEMRRLVGWQSFPVEEAAVGLAHSTILCCIRKDGLPIALGRVISDLGYVAYIADIIVCPDYQGQGLGRILMDHILDRIRENMKPGYRVMVSLLSAQGKEEFYQKFGFVSRPNEWYGCGMHQWIEG